jgi:hypothetical protein
MNRVSHRWRVVWVGMLLASATGTSAAGTDARPAPTDGASPAQRREPYLALDRFYIRVDDRCVAWEVRDHVARNRRKTPLGEVVLEIEGSSYRRIGPADRLMWRSQALACTECGRDPYTGQPEFTTGRVSCSPVPSAGWYATRAECQGAATPPPAERTIRHCVVQALSAAALREDDAREARAYARAPKALKAAEAAARARLRIFLGFLARTRVIYERQASGCRAWQFRKDPGTASGWLSHHGKEYVVTFHFVAKLTEFTFTRPMITPLPGHLPMLFAGDCHLVTNLIAVDAHQATFHEQVWYLSRTACETAPYTASRYLGPGCH